MELSSISPEAAGLLAAAFLSSLGYLYKVRRESKQSARRVLYLLLEIRYSVRLAAIRPDEIKTKLVYAIARALEQKGIPAFPSDFDETVKTAAVGHIIEISEAAKTDIHERLVEPFEQALSEYSLSSPTMAFRLRGKQKIDHLIKITSDYAKSTAKNNINNLVKDESLRAVALKNLEKERKATIESISSDLDRDIKRLALKCSPMDYLQTILLLKKTEGAIGDSIYHHINSLASELADEIIMATTPKPNKDFP